MGAAGTAFLVLVEVIVGIVNDGRIDIENSHVPP
jgi:hypothetical protein